MRAAARAALALLLLAPPVVAQAPRAPRLDGRWRAVLEQAGGPLRFAITLGGAGTALRGTLCNGARCEPFSRVALAGDSLVLELADYAAAITARLRGDSLVGSYRNVGNRGPRVIPFRAARGPWPVPAASPALAGTWDAWFYTELDSTPRVLQFTRTARGLEGTVLSSSGDYGLFWGGTRGDSVDLAHFDGSFVYRLSGTLARDTLRGEFHAGLRSRTPFVAVRSRGPGHLTPPAEVTAADTTRPFAFAFPDLDGRLVTQDDPRFRGKVLVVDVFGTWCPTCHDAAPTLVQLHREFRGRGVEMVGLAYEVTGDSAADAPLVRRYRDKFGITFPLLLAGTNTTAATAATLPQLLGFTAYPTTIFLGRDGRVRRVHAGFHGPATGALHAQVVREFRELLETLVQEGDRR